MKVIKNSVDIIIISYNGKNFTLDCIKSIYNTLSGIDYNIIVVDNASNDATVIEIKKTFPAVKIIVNEKNLGYAAAVNAGVSLSEAEILVISNNDVIFLPGSLLTLVNTLLYDSQTGIAGLQQIYPDGKWQYSYGDFPGIKAGLKDMFLISSISRFFNQLFWKSSFRKRIRVLNGYIDGAVLAVRKSIFDEIGGFDTNFFFYSEEADFCYRTKKSGRKLIIVPKAIAIHYRGGANNTKVPEFSQIEMLNLSKIKFCNKNMKPVTSKIYIVAEIIYSVVFIIIYGVSGIFKHSLISRSKIMRLHFKFWLKSFKYIGS